MTTMTTMTPITITIEAVQWFPGAEIPGVEPEPTVLKGSEPEVTHGLMLPPGGQPIQLKDADGKPTKAKVGDTVYRTANLHYAEGNTETVNPGDWIVNAGGKITVLTPAEFAATYPQAQPAA